MKKIIPTIAAMLLLSIYGIAQKTAEIDLENNMFDFGIVTTGNVAEHSFTFNNSGRAPLIISDVKAQCSCTTVEWTKEPVEPGKQGFVKVTYDTKKIGTVVKKLTITSNARTNIKDIAVKIHVVDLDTPNTPKDSSVAPVPPGE